MSPRRPLLEPRHIDGDHPPSSPPSPSSNGRRSPLLKFLGVIVLLGLTTSCLDLLLKGRGELGFGISTRSVGKAWNSAATGETPVDGPSGEIPRRHRDTIDAAAVAAASLDPTEATKTTTLAIVCQLSGEFGNNIGKFVHAYVLRRKLERLEQERQRRQNQRHRFRYRIVLRHQLHDKWLRARDDVQRCFPTSLGKLDFERGNGPDFETQLESQRQRHWMEQFESVNVSPRLVDGALRNFTRIATGEAEPATTRNASDSAIGLPFLWSDAFAMHPTFAEFVDEYYNGIRNLLEFDAKDCCALMPDPDETVLHHRNFFREMPRAGVRLGFAEMEPDEAARRLLGHLEPGDRVAVVSRFDAVSEAPLVHALSRRGLRVRLVQDQTGVQDFCFLMHARRELIGPGKSTFFFWAAVLGNATRVRSYWLDTPEVRANIGGDFREDYVWRTPELRERFRIELYPVDRGSGQDARL